MKTKPFGDKRRKIGFNDQKTSNKLLETQRIRTSPEYEKTIT